MWYSEGVSQRQREREKSERREERANANGNNIELHPIWPEDEKKHVFTTLEREAHIVHDGENMRQKSLSAMANTWKYLHQR